MPKSKYVSDSSSTSSWNGRSQFWSVFLVLVAMTIGFNYLIKKPHVSSPVGLNSPFPPIEVVGWFGGKEGPTKEQLAGKVYVVDAWAYWCEPCQVSVPKLIAIYEKFKDRGVQVIGVTEEGLDQQSLEMSAKFVELLKIPYPCGYGAQNFFSKLKIEGLPQLWVINREGLVAYFEDGWHPDAPAAIEAAIEKALAAPEPPAAVVAPAADSSTETKAVEETKEAPSK